MKRLLALLALASLPLLASRATAEGPRGHAVEYKHDATALEGYLALPEGAGKHPGVLVVHEWWGHNDYVRHRADMLAKLGYVAFALDMYGKGVSTKDPGEAGKLSTPFRNDRALMRARANAGLEVLAKNEAVDPSKIAAIGYCFGGTTALELARSGAPLAGVVAFHAGLDTPSPADAKTLKAKVLVCNGADDGFVPEKDIVAFEDEMRKANADWQLIQYSGSVHAFTNPDADKFGIKGIAYNANADRRSWQAMRTFFEEIFGAK